MGGEALEQAELGRPGSPVEMTHLDRGIFDAASISAITSATVGESAQLAGHSPDVRRFRPNILISSEPSIPFEEDKWVGGVLTFGEGDAAAVMAVTRRDERCSKVNLDPDPGRPTPEALKAVVRERDNKAETEDAEPREACLRKRSHAPQATSQSHRHTQPRTTRVSPV